MRDAHKRLELRPVLAMSLALLAVAGILCASDPEPAWLDAGYGPLELSFEANWGQADPAVQFLARGAGYGLLLTPTEAIVAVSRVTLAGKDGPRRALRKGQRSDREFALVKVRLEGANGAAQILGEGLLPGQANYFSGSDPARWITGVPTYRKVRAEGVYPGVDLVYYGNQRELEFDFVVAPGADPDSIRLTYDGVEDMRLDPNGDLVLRTRLGEIRQHSPSVYQEEEGQLKQIPASHVLLEGGNVGFKVRDYDRARPLVIDPRLSYSTLLGGSLGDGAASVAVDSSGNAYVTGLTISTNFPVVSPYQSSPGPGIDTFITKLNPTGTALVYSTYLHGLDGDTLGATIAVDNSGSAYVGGSTTSYSFPTTGGAYQRTTNDDCCTDGFLTKLSPAGSQLVFSTYITGPKDDDVLALRVDAAGAVHAVGDTESGAGFPIKSGSFQTTSGGGLEAFALKLEPTGAALAYSTFLGGSGGEQGMSVAVDSGGNAYVAGWTDSPSFPATAGAYRTSGGAKDAFVAKFNSTGSALTYSARFGGTGDDPALAVAIDAQGNAYVTGRSTSIAFPASTGAFQTTNRGGEDAFVVKLNPAGSAPVYATLIGGGGVDKGWGVTVDSAGNAYVAGYTESANFPVSSDAIQATLAGTRDGFVAKFNPTGSALPISTYLGGSGDDSLFGLAMDPGGFLYVAGDTESVNFPTTSGAYQTTLRGLMNAFIAKLDVSAPAPPVLFIVSGNNQTGTVGTALPAPLIVELRSGGAPVAGATVTFTSSGAAATLNPASAQTGADGRASTVVTPTASGTVTITAATTGAASVTFTATAQAAPAAVTVTSAASFRAGPMAPGMIAVAWGQGFTSGLFTATSLPLPTSLGGVSVSIRDSAGIERPQSLFFVNATQVNFYLDDATQGGPATIRITGQDSRVQTANLTIENVNPGLFSLNADGQGIVAGNVIRVSASGAQTVLDIMRYDSALRKWVGNPIDFGGINDRIFLVLYGTGFRHRSALANVNATVGGVALKVDYLGAQGSMVGLDQFNFELPRAMAGRGDVPIVLTVDGKTANTVTVNVAAVTPPPTLSSVSPNTARAGDTVNLVLNGTTLAGAQIEFNPAAGLTLSNVNSTNTQVTATLKIDGSAAPGARTVAVSTNYGRSNNLTFTITPPPVPTLTSISPTSARAGDTVTLTLRGTNLTGSEIEFEPSDGLTLSNVNASSSTQVTATLAIDVTAATGPRTLRVTNSQGSSNTLTFTINAAPAPSISSLSPRSGDAGTTFTLRISGSNLAAVTGVEFTAPDGITVEEITPSASSVTARITIDASATPGDRRVAVVSPAGRSGTLTFTINAGVDPNYVISNLRVGPAVNSSSGATLPVTVDFVDPQGGSITGDTRMNFNVSNGGITGWSMPATVSGTTSGTISMQLSFFGIRFTTGVDIPISISVERPPGVRKSNTLSGSFRAQ